MVMITFQKLNGEWTVWIEGERGIGQGATKREALINAVATGLQMTPKEIEQLALIKFAQRVSTIDYLVSGISDSRTGNYIFLILMLLRRIMAIRCCCSLGV